LFRERGRVLIQIADVLHLLAEWRIVWRWG
jgi:hypothetical protein